MEFNTIAIHTGQTRDVKTGAIIPPLYLSTTFEQSTQDPLKYFYSRGENPTRENLEECLAALEGDGQAVCFSSGQAASAAVLSLLEPGDEYISSNDIYGGTLSLFESIKKTNNINFKLVDLTQIEELKDAITEETKLIWIESPTNPLLKIIDIREISDFILSLNREIKVVVDNTFASSYLQKPLDLGADFVLYSTTKYFSGHADVVGGALICKQNEYFQRIYNYRTVTGAVPSPFDCFLIHRGIKTLSLRIDRQVQNAKLVVEFLLRSNKVLQVIYPGLETHPQYNICTQQMKQPGAIISFKYKGDVNELMYNLKYFHCAVSLGAVNSLIECPYTMTHRNLSVDSKKSLGLSNDIVRLSVGTEDFNDLKEDLSRFL